LEINKKRTTVKYEDTNSRRDGFFDIFRSCQFVGFTFNLEVGCDVQVALFLFIFAMNMETE